MTPPVQCKPLRMHVSHPTPTYIQEERLREHLIHTELSKKAANYHKICTKMTVQFPELRLIQYDCGKLLTLSILMVFPIHIDTKTMGLPIVYLKGSQVEFSELYDVFLSLNLSKQRRS